MVFKVNLQGKLLVTGHTGFKGTWLTLLAEELGLEVIGLSLPPQKESLYSRLNREALIEEYFVDINDYQELERVIRGVRPTAVLHLAAQSLVEESYLRPLETFRTNVIGTANLLEACRNVQEVKVISVATTDKVYKNSNLGISFVETDALGGKDPYSASKVGAESAVDAWRQISSLEKGPSVSSFRAGNVIGGGDMAENRIVPDLIRSRKSKKPAIIRYPESTRPWQHVLDPLMGYLIAMEMLIKDSDSITSLNFGPSGESLKVAELVSIALRTDSSIPHPRVVESKSINRESLLLGLDSSRAREILAWDNQWTQTQSIEATFHWWKSVLENELSPYEACQRDLQRLLKS